MSQTNPVVRLIPLQGNAGALTVIRCSVICGYMEISEDSAVNAGAMQGLQGNYLDPFTAAPNPAAGVEVWYPPQDYPIAIGDPRHEHGAQTKPIGNPGSGTYTDTRSQTPQVLNAGPGYQAPSLGTPVIQLRSNTLVATTVRVKEWTA